jgi:murein DD-endopeptidase MepM/ murein hydrolase activator NlpD
VPRKKGRQPLTLIVVPHSERAPVSICIPTWLLPVMCVLGLALLFGAGFLAVRSRYLDAEIRALQEEKELQVARAREMRDTILAQQEDVQGLSQQVEGFEAELAGVRTLSDEIRGLIGVSSPSAAPSATPAVYADPTVGSTARTARLADSDPNGQGGRLGGGLSDRSMMMAMEKSQDVVGMQATLPRTFRVLADLREEVLARMERIEPEKRTNPVDLEKQLRLLAAAPHFWPTEVRRISSKFGYRTLRGRLEFHKGIDMPMWYGTQVRATQDGVVAFAGWESGTGWTVELEHSLGFTTVYGHNSQLLLSQGDEVRAGDVIALSGNSGNSTGPHVHYEIRLNGTSVDPLKYLDMDQPLTFEK